MEERIVIGGLGGQGILVIGKVLSHACVLEGKEIAYMEAYGDNVRGGAVSCSLVISDEPIASPIVEEPTIGVALGPNFVDSLESRLEQGGLLIVNESLIPHRHYRRDLFVLEIPATQQAVKLGTRLLANMVALGGLIGYAQIVSLESVFRGLERVLPDYRKSMISTNREGIGTGYAYGLSMRKGKP